jgi:hypothetical protein
VALLIGESSVRRGQAISSLGVRRLYERRDTCKCRCKQFAETSTLLLGSLLASAHNCGLIQVGSCALKELTWDSAFTEQRIEANDAFPVDAHGNHRVDGEFSIDRRTVHEHDRKLPRASNPETAAKSSP